MQEKFIIIISENAQMGSFLTVKVMGIIAAVLALLMVAFGVYHFFYMSMLESKIKEQAQDIVRLEGDKAVLKANNLTLTEAVEKQNKYISEMERSQKEAMKIALNLVDAANAATKKMKEKYNALLNSPKPEGSETEALSLRVDQYLRMRQEDVAPPKDAV